jgi:hypothetical protein
MPQGDKNNRQEWKKLLRTARNRRVLIAAMEWISGGKNALVSWVTEMKNQTYFTKLNEQLLTKDSFSLTFWDPENTYWTHLTLWWPVTQIWIFFFFCVFALQLWNTDDADLCFQHALGFYALNYTIHGAFKKRSSGPDFLKKSYFTLN